MTATINWRHHATGKNIDGATLPSGTGVRLASHRHLAPPNEYEVHQLIPKPFWRFWGVEQVLVTKMGVYPQNYGDVGGWFFSDDVWHLPEPNNAAGTVIFRASTDTGEGPSGPLSSARIWLDEIRQHSSITAGADAQLSMPGITFGPKGARENGVERSWRVRVAADPWVEVALLQGSDVLEHLIALEEQYSHTFAEQPVSAMADLPADSAVYFVDRPFGEARLEWRLEPEDGLMVAVAAEHRLDMRSVYCVSVTDHTDGATFITNPVFLTSLRDRIVTTDLTFDMLRGESRDSLQFFDEVNLDIEVFASRLGLSRADGWQRLVDAADELGADSITDAAHFAGLASPAYA